MGLRPILRRVILRHQPHRVVLATERAAIAGNGTVLHTNSFTPLLLLYSCFWSYISVTIEN
jgi:hypothetical protein